MEQQGRRDTKPEIALRRAVWALGLRYRVDLAPVRGSRSRADMVFLTERVAVFVDGCFWHRCPEHASIPKSNRDWWVAKLEANAVRDRSTDAVLAANGWAVVRVWEHEDVTDAAALLARVVAARRRSNPGRTVAPS
jgi:DNA mismatch endonuclease (patch repair protein)